MEHPFVVCHMLTSLDGKIDGTFFGVPETVPAIKAYGELRSFYGCQATLYGTTTMLEGYAEGKVGQLPTVVSTPPRADWVNPTGKAMGNFIVAVDPQGQLAYSGLSIEKKGPPRRPCDRGADGAGGSRIPVLFTGSRGFLSVCRRETTELHSAFGETASTVWHQQTDAGGRRDRQWIVFG